MCLLDTFWSAIPFWICGSISITNPYLISSLPPCLRYTCSTVSHSQVVNGFDFLMCTSYKLSLLHMCMFGVSNSYHLILRDPCFWRHHFNLHLKNVEAKLILENLLLMELCMYTDCLWVHDCVCVCVSAWWVSLFVLSRMVVSLCYFKISRRDKVLCNIYVYTNSCICIHVHI